MVPKHFGFVNPLPLDKNKNIYDLFKNFFTAMQVFSLNELIYIMIDFSIIIKIKFILYQEIVFFAIRSLCHTILMKYFFF